MSLLPHRTWQASVLVLQGKWSGIVLSVATCPIPIYRTGELVQGSQCRARGGLRSRLAPESLIALPACCSVGSTPRLP